MRRQTSRSRRHEATTLAPHRTRACGGHPHPSRTASPYDVRALSSSFDIHLAVDAMELVFTRPEIGTYILLSGDSDFASLVTKLKEYGKYVIGVGIRESSSDLLVMNCDEYYSYNALAGLVKASEDEPRRKYDPWELVKEAIAQM